MHILDVLLLLLATTVIAPLFWEFQPQSNNTAGSVVVPKTTLLSLTTLLKHKYAKYGTKCNSYALTDWPLIRKVASRHLPYARS